MQEKWKSMKGYEGLYEVSNTGKVYNLRRDKLSKLFDDGRGYLYCHLFSNGRAKSKKVQRLVAETFIENSANEKQVNHIDGNKKNNCVTNLEWCDHKYNIRHAYENQLIKKGKNLKARMFSENEIIHSRRK